MGCSRVIPLTVVSARVLSRQATARADMVLGGMLSCVMVPPNGSANFGGEGCDPPASDRQE
jgi:hypothetical protein